MEKKYLRIGAYLLGGLLILLLLANFGLNFWLAHYLPDYVKNNSDYRITYKTLNVELSTGDIRATGITVNSKNPQNADKLGMQGTVEGLSISRFGIYDAVFNKKINSKSLALQRPHLNIILPAPQQKNGQRQQSPLQVSNIKITNGDIAIFTARRQKYLSVKNLNLDVENFRMNEETVQEKLPVAFDKYDIAGDNFFFRPDDVYAFTARHVTTKNAQIALADFRLTPLLSYADFRKFFPKKRNLFNFYAPEMRFSDIVFGDDKLSFSDVYFRRPDLKMYTTNAKPEEKQRSFTYKVNLDNVRMEDSKINILKPDGSPMFGVSRLTMDISKIVMDDETAKGNLPFKYEKFRIDGDEVLYATDNQKITVGKLFADPKTISLTQVAARPVGTPDKTSLDLAAGSIKLDINSWKFQNNKLAFDGRTLSVEGLAGKITTSGEKSPDKKTPFSGIEYPLKLSQILIKNSNIAYENNGKTLAFQNLNADIKNLLMDAESAKAGVPFRTGGYTLAANGFSYRIGPDYMLASGSIHYGAGGMSVTNFEMKPLISRAEFKRKSRYGSDQYSIKIAQITTQGSWDFMGEKKYMNMSRLTIDGAAADIYEVDGPQNPSEKPLYPKVLRGINFPIYIGDVFLKNSNLVFEEQGEETGAGKLIFSNIDADIKNLNSNKMAGKPTNVDINITAKFMNASPMHVKWGFNSADMADGFRISGHVSDLPAERINPFLKPYLNVAVTSGSIPDLSFDFHGNKAGIAGTMNMKHQDLKIAVLDKDTKEKKKFLSAIANLVVKSSSDKFPESVTVDGVKRDPQKSFYNLFWNGLQDGLKKTLLGKSAASTLKTVQTTVDAAKGKTTPTTAANAAPMPKAPPVEEKKTGFFKKIFRKKEKAGD